MDEGTDNSRGPQPPPWPPGQHTLHKCPPGTDPCTTCRGGLAVCTVCGGAEGSLPTACPGFRIDDDRVYRGQVDYVLRGPYVIEIENGPDGWRETSTSLARRITGKEGVDRVRAGAEGESRAWVEKPQGWLPLPDVKRALASRPEDLGDADQP